MLGHPTLQPQIFPGDIFKLHLTAAANIESNRTVSARCILRYPAPGLATPIQEIANNVGVQIYLDFVPVAGSKRCVWRHEGQHRALSPATATSPPATAGWRGWRRNSHLATARPQLLSVHNLTLRVEVHFVRSNRGVREGDIDTFHAIPGPGETHKNASPATWCAPKRRVDPAVLQGLVEHQNPPAVLLRRCGDLSILNLPVRRPDCLPSGQGRSLHRSI